MPVSIYGYLACECIQTIMPFLENALKRQHFIRQNLDGYITQGCYNNNVRASAGTHSGGGVWDFEHSLTQGRSEELLRTFDYYGWHLEIRTQAQGFSIAHLHGVVMTCPHLSEQAKWQVAQFERGLNGLITRGATWPPNRGITDWRSVPGRELTNSPNINKPIQTIAPYMEETAMRVVLNTDGSAYLITPSGTRHITDRIAAAATARVLTCRPFGTAEPERVHQQEIELANAVISGIADDKIAQMARKLAATAANELGEIEPSTTAGS